MNDNILEDIESAVSEVSDGAVADTDATGGDPGTVVQADGPKAPEVQEAAGDDREGTRPDGRARGPDGKFIPKTAAEEAKAATKPKALTPPEKPAQTPPPPPAPGTPTQTPEPVTGEQSQALKPPQSWGPVVREHWGKLPAEVQQAIDKRERDMTRGLQEAAPARKFQQDFQATIAPYEAHIRSQGADPMKAIGSLLQTSYALTSAPPAHKAQVVAQIIKGYGVDIAALDSILSGEAAPQSAPQQFDPNAIAQQVQQQVMQTIQQQRMEAHRSKAAQEIEAFASEKPFFDDLREEVADYMEVAAKRGIAMTLEQAYSRALKVHESDDKSEIGIVLRQRKAAEAAKANQASTQRAKVASSSVRSQPASVQPQSGGPKSIMEEMMESAKELSGR